MRRRGARCPPRPARRAFDRGRGRRARGRPTAVPPRCAARAEIVARLASRRRRAAARTSASSRRAAAATLTSRARRPPSRTVQPRGQSCDLLAERCARARARSSCSPRSSICTCCADDRAERGEACERVLHLRGRDAHHERAASPPSPDAYERRDRVAAELRTILSARCVAFGERVGESTSSARSRCSAAAGRARAPRPAACCALSRRQSAPGPAPPRCWSSAGSRSTAVAAPRPRAPRLRAPVARCRSRPPSERETGSGRNGEEQGGAPRRRLSKKERSPDGRL